MSHLRTILLVLLLVGFFSAPALAQGPSADWRTLDTPHFRVHYPAPSEAWARRAAARLEAIRERVAAEVGLCASRGGRRAGLRSGGRPERRGVSLPRLAPDAPVDQPARAGVGPRPLPRLGRDPDRPRGDAPGAPPAAVAQPGPPAPRPDGPGRARSRSTAPRWVMEGYATVVEGRLTGAGRPNSDLRAAILRRWAQAGTAAVLRAARLRLPELAAGCPWPTCWARPIWSGWRSGPGRGACGTSGRG